MAYTSNSCSLIARMIIITSARCRQEATASGMSTKPAIYASLNKMGYGILAPVVDSLLSFFEIYAGRSFRAGMADDKCVTKDEQHLLDMLGSSDCSNTSYWKAPSPYNPSPALVMAIKSTRVMLSLVLAQPAPRSSKRRFMVRAIAGAQRGVELPSEVRVN